MLLPDDGTGVVLFWGSAAPQPVLGWCSLGFSSFTTSGGCCRDPRAALTERDVQKSLPPSPGQNSGYQSLSPCPAECKEDCTAQNQLDRLSGQIAVLVVVKAAFDTPEERRAASCQNCLSITPDTPVLASPVACSALVCQLLICPSWSLVPQFKQAFLAQRLLFIQLPQRKISLSNGELVFLQSGQVALQL